MTKCPVRAANGRQGWRFGVASISVAAAGGRTFARMTSDCSTTNTEGAGRKANKRMTGMQYANCGEHAVKVNVGRVFMTTMSADGGISAIILPVNGAAMFTSNMIKPAFWGLGQISQEGLAKAFTSFLQEEGGHKNLVVKKIRSHFVESSTVKNWWKNSGRTRETSQTT